jgi:chromosome segregation ATPase
MPEVEKIRSESEKMVPIDTSGDPVDVELKDDKTKEEEVVAEEVQEETEVQETTSDNKEEAEEYSQSVKKRIDKLTFKVREAERQREEALRYAQSVKKERDELGTKIKKVDDGYLTEYSARVKSELDKAQSILAKAIDDGDAKKQVEAQKAIAKLTIEEERAALSLKQREENKKTKTSLEETPPSTQQEPLPSPDPKAEEWAERNEWFGKNEGMTYTALSIHKKLIEQEGFDGKSDEYYKELDKRIKKEFPHKFEDKDKSSRVVQTVASATRSTKSGRRTVRLTPSQVAIAKKLGVPLDEYAKHVKEA